jgi:Iap family predicted aminopeptidase
MKRRLEILCVVVACLQPAFAQSPTKKFQLTTTADAVVWDRLGKFGGDNRFREQTLKSMFTEAGCKPEQLIELPVKHTPAPNVLCKIPGEESSRVIVIGAHFDYVARGKGVVDNWSGASMLPSLLEAILKEPRRHTYVFIGFTDEEQGMVGSADYVRHLSERERANIAGMVNLDTVGLGPTEVWLSHASPELLQPLAVIAKTLKLPLFRMDVERVGSSDSESFRDRKIPALTIHSLTQTTLPILHSSKDTIEQISRKDYLDTYRLVAGYLVYLDGYLDDPSGVSSTAK